MKAKQNTLMSSPVEFLVDYQPETEDQLQFQVVKLHRFQKILYALMILFSPFLFFSATGQNVIGFIIYLACSISFFITPRIWNKIVQKFIKTNIVYILQSNQTSSTEDKIKDPKHPTLKDRLKEFLNNLLGLNMDSDQQYYMEVQAKKLDLNKFKTVVLQRIMDLISSCLAISFLFLTVFLAFLKEINKSNLDIVIMVLLVLIFVSPMITSFITPIIWTLQDGDLRSISKEYEVRTSAQKIRNGIFRKFLGSSGIILGYSVILDYLDVLPNLGGNSVIQRYLQATLYLIIAILMIALPNLLLFLIYSSKYHEDNVNLTRNALKTILPMGQTVVKSFNR